MPCHSTPGSPMGLKRTQNKNVRFLSEAAGVEHNSAGPGDPGPLLWNMSGNSALEHEW